MFNFLSKGLRSEESRCESPSRAKRAGFTLIEILVVVAIIALLAGTVLVGLATVTQKGRDARRISDLKSIQAGLELYFTKNGCYPSGGSTGTSCGNGGAMTLADLKNVLALATIGVNNTPDDPRANSGTHYLYGSDGSDYRLEATLEDHSNPVLSAGNAITDTKFAVACGPDPKVTGTYCVAP
jgi:general secretion pathway protein G